MKHVVILLILISTTSLFAQDLEIKIPEPNFNSSLLLNIKSDKAIILNVVVFNLEENKSIKEIILNITNKPFYKIDLSDLEKERKFNLIIKKEDEIVFRSIISNFTNK